MPNNKIIFSSDKLESQETFQNNSDFPYIDLLNPEQKEAVTHFGSPLLILAGAGSGKTRVITTKIAYLISQKNVNPHSILAVTFTKKAANEMRDRAIAMEERAEHSQIKTFHSFGAWFLRKYALEAKLSKSFTVYDDDDMTTLIMKALPHLRRPQASIAAHKISLAKDFCLSPEDDLSDIDPTGNLAEIYTAYEKRLSETGNVDFGDLILKPVKVMKNYKQIREQMQFRFRIILVDEYQDSNVAQFKLLQTLSSTEDSKNYVCVVGDDDQSIYKFRGAEVQNILTFKDTFPNTKIIKLIRNYRSTSNILNVADNIVKNNTGRIGKTLKAEREDGKKPVLAYLPNQDAEVEFCADVIELSLKKQNTTYSDWAILYRTNAQSMLFEHYFLRRKIPYVVVGSLKFYEREEIKDTLAFLSLIANPKDEISFRRIINKPTRSIGEKMQEIIIENARKKSISFIESAKECANDLTKKAKTSAIEFCNIYEEIINTFSENEKLSLLVEKVIERSGLLEYHKVQDEIASTQRALNMQEIINSASVYECSEEGLLEFLDSIALDRSLETENNDKDAVTLITLHNTKGLEFSRVIITGVENGIFPRNDKTGSELEEERRLFYVGVTRAKDELYITSCAMRRIYGRMEFTSPSIFLSEAGDVFKIIGENPRKTFYSENNTFSENNLDLAKKWKKGERVYHDDFGYGQIIFTSENDSKEFVITVQFENGMKNKFLPEYQSHSLTIIKD